MHFIILPGCVGRLIILRIVCPLMVIVVIDIMSVTINKFKKYTPISGYFHCMKVPFVATQLVEEGPRIIHISYFTRGIKPIKNSFKPLGMFRLNSSLAPSIKKVFQAFMFKGFYHGLRSVTQKVTFVNTRFTANGELTSATVLLREPPDFYE